jgi:hypothetical protein
MKRPVRGRDVLVMTPLQLLKKLAAVTPPRGKRGLAPSLRATMVPSHRGSRQSLLPLDLPAVPRPRSHAPPPGAKLHLAS